MSLMAHLARLSRYHQWASETLYQSVETLTDSDYHRDIDLFFGSIHGTLNHLLLAEQIWWGRIQQQPIRFSGLDQEVQPDRALLRAASAEQAQRWQQLLTGQPVLYQPINYRDSKDQPRQLVLADILLHVFNHGSHHRGQISSGLTVLGARAPEMDLLYYLLPRPDEQLRDGL